MCKEMSRKFTVKISYPEELGNTQHTFTVFTVFAYYITPAPLEGKKWSHGKTLQDPQKIVMENSCSVFFHSLKLFLITFSVFLSGTKNETYTTR